LIEIEGFKYGSVFGITLRRIVGEVVGSIEGTIVGLRIRTTEEMDEEGNLYFLLLLSLIVFRIKGKM